MKRISVAVLSLALVALAPVAVSGAKKPPSGGGGGTFTLAASPNPIVYGSTTVVSGRLTGAHNSGRSITLRADAFPYDGVYHSIATATTDTAGRYSFGRIKPLVGTRYVARLQSRLTNTVSVPVRSRVSLHVSDSTPSAGSVVRFSGRSCPTHNGTVVAIKRKGRDHRYHTVRRTFLVASTRCSVYSRRIRVNHDGRFIAVVARAGGNARGISHSRVVNVH